MLLLFLLCLFKVDSSRISVYKSIGPYPSFLNHVFMIDEFCVNHKYSASNLAFLLHLLLY